MCTYVLSLCPHVQGRKRDTGLGNGQVGTEEDGWWEALGGEVDIYTPCCAHLLSHVQLSATPQTVARQAPLSVGFPRQE